MARFGPTGTAWLAVALGGAFGSLARWAAVTAADDQRTAAVFGLNVVGSLLLGGLLGQQERLGRHRLEFLGVGFAGGLTTFSTFAVTVAQRLDDGRLVDATITGLATPVAAVLAAGVGYRLSRLTGARWMAHRSHRRQAGRG